MAEITDILFKTMILEGFESGIVEGKANSRPYHFEIERPLSEMGYRSELLDSYPAPDGKGYLWTARVWKRDPQIVTVSQYRKITNNSGLDCWNVRFGIEEMQEILIANGYQIIVHVAKAEITEVKSEDCEVRPTGRKWIENVEKILAVTEEDKKNLPEWNDSGRASYLYFENVFNRLIKAKLSKP